MIKVITEDQRDKSFEFLKSYNSLKLDNKTLNSSGYFFNEFRIKARRKGGKSLSEELNIKKIIEIAKRYKKNGKSVTDADIRRTSQMYYGLVNQFRPEIAKYVYKKFQVKNTLDPCAGWGDRCVAAIASDIHYTGIDINVNLKEPFNRLINHYSGNCKFISGDSLIVIEKLENNYDLIFTSIPFWNLEVYECSVNYKTFKEFIDLFVNKLFEICLKKTDLLLIHMTEKIANNCAYNCTPQIIYSSSSRPGTKIKTEIIYKVVIK